MVRLLGYIGPKVCAILHLPQIYSKPWFFGKKQENKKTRGHPRCLHLRAKVNRDTDEFIFLWEFGTDVYHGFRLLGDFYGQLSKCKVGEV